MKTAKYFYHYTVYKNLPDRQVVVGQGSGVTDCDLTIMGENGEECPFTLLTAKLRKACNVESSTELFLDIDVVTKL